MIVRKAHGLHRVFCENIDIGSRASEDMGRRGAQSGAARCRERQWMRPVPAGLLQKTPAGAALDWDVWHLRSDPAPGAAASAP